jgi:hypothetical protein
MLAEWSNSMKVKSVDEDWESWPKTPGVYIIRGEHAIQRIGGIDRTGILYIGKTKNLRNRIWQFLEANHTASGFLWTHPTIARLVIDPLIRTKDDVEDNLGKLKVMYSTPLKEKQLDNAERILLFTYINKFGEAPPLNFSLPHRWKDSPTDKELINWAKVGIRVNHVGPDQDDR